MSEYAFQKFDKEKMSRARATFMPISAKFTREIARFIVEKNVLKAINELEKVQKLKQPIPLKRYHKDVGHKRGMCEGRYPVKACKYIVEVLENAIANAKQKGFSEEDLVIAHASTSLSLPRERKRGKFTTFEVVLENKPEKKEKKETKKPVKTKEEVQKDVKAVMEKIAGKNPEAKKEEKKKPVKAKEEKPDVKKEEIKKEVKVKEKAEKK